MLLHFMNTLQPRETKLFRFSANREANNFEINFPALCDRLTGLKLVTGLAWSPLREQDGVGVVKQCEVLVMLTEKKSLQLPRDLLWLLPSLSGRKLRWSHQGPAPSQMQCQLSLLWALVQWTQLQDYATTNAVCKKKIHLILPKGTSSIRNCVVENISCAMGGNALRFCC